MNSEEDEPMRALDARLRKALSGLDATEGFEARLQARLSPLVAARRAQDLVAMRAELEREHHRRRAAARRAALMDGAAVSVAGAGVGLAAWLFAPEITRLYAAAEQAGGSTGIGFATLALTAAALWFVLRSFGVNPAALATGRPWNASTS